jgi:hypothetical protein
MGALTADCCFDFSFTAAILLAEKTDVGKADVSFSALISDSDCHSKILSLCPIKGIDS